MRKLTLSLLCIVFLGTAYSQDVIKLDELKMEFNPKSLEIDESLNSLIYEVSEDYVGQFHSNPMKYAKQNFNIMDFISANRDKEYDSYEVTFITNKGNLKVNYNKEGKIISSSQKFININLPYNSLISVLKANKGYRIVGTKHLAFSKAGGNFNKEFYKVKLENGKKSKIVKMNIKRDASGVAVATIVE